jgi:hypothetical protein
VKLSVSAIEDMGEESGREEAAERVPFLPRLSALSPQEIGRYRRMLTRRGRGRAQGPIYNLRGRYARRFAWCWALGYVANCDMFERDGYLDTEEEAQEAFVRVLEKRIL